MSSPGEATLTFKNPAAGSAEARQAPRPPGGELTPTQHTVNRALAQARSGRARHGTTEVLADLPQITHQPQPHDCHRQSRPHPEEATLKTLIDRGRLWWGVEGRCQDRPNAWCETDTGSAPEEVRQALLTKHGAARLRLANTDASLGPVLRALREIRHLSLGEARRMAADLKEVGLAGTSVEMAYLADGLRSRSVTVTITSSPT